MGVCRICMLHRSRNVDDPMISSAKNEITVKTASERFDMAYIYSFLQAALGGLLFGYD